LPDGTATIPFDLAARNFDAALLAAVDVVFHLAGIAHQQAAARDYEAVNHQGTLRLAHLAAEAGVGCFVYLSSVKAMGSAAGPAAREEGDVVPPTDPYGVSKWRAECDLRAAFSGAAMAVRILRPALVYGPGVKGNLQNLLRAIRMGLPQPPEEGARSMVALPDLVALMMLAAQADEPGVHTWIACDGEAYSTRRIYQALRRADGKGAGLAWLPRPLWHLAVAVADRLLAGEDSLADKLFGYELYRNDLARAALGWEPRLQLEDLAPAIVAEPARR
jgi:UDP-glucose 4-epimerase